MCVIACDPVLIRVQVHDSRHIGGVASHPRVPVCRVHIQPDVESTESLSFGNPICRCVDHNSALKHSSGVVVFQQDCLRSLLVWTWGTRSCS